MSFPILTSGQYDAQRYEPLGTVIYNNVHSVSLIRSIVAGWTSMTGGRNRLIQEAVDRMHMQGLAEFRQKISREYPNTALVVGMQYTIDEVGAGDTQTMYMVLTITGTCLRSNQSGGRKTRRSSHKVDVITKT